MSPGSQKKKSKVQSIVSVYVTNLQTALKKKYKDISLFEYLVCLHWQSNDLHAIHTIETIDTLYVLLVKQKNCKKSATKSQDFNICNKAFGSGLSLPPSFSASGIELKVAFFSSYTFGILGLNKNSMLFDFRISAFKSVFKDSNFP